MERSATGAREPLRSQNNGEGDRKHKGGIIVELEESAAEQKREASCRNRRSGPQERT